MNTTPRPFNLAVDQADGQATVRVTGEIDMETAPALQSRLLDLAAAGADLVTVDLADTDFIDSTGLHAIVVGVKQLRERGADLIVKSPSPPTARVLELSGLDTVVKVV